MLRWAVSLNSGPVAIRYPRGGNGAYTDTVWNAEEDDNCTIYQHRAGKDIAIVTYGIMVNNAMEAAQILFDQGIDVSVFRLTQLAPLPITEIVAALSAYKTTYIVEEISGNCGICAEIAMHLTKEIPNMNVLGVDLGNQYIQHGALDKLYDHYGLSGKKIAESIMEVTQGEN